MKSKIQRSNALRVCTAAALFATLGQAWVPTASAQLPPLGSLVVSMTAPASGSLIRGTVTVSANVTIIGSLTVSGVQFQLDGVNLGAEDTTAPYSIAWNTTTASSGPHTLKAVGRAILLTFDSEPVTVTVDNVPPTVVINQAGAQADPTNAAPVSFSVVFSEPVSDFAASDVTIGGTAGGARTVAVTGGPTAYNVVVSGLTDGTVIATIPAGGARDAAGNFNTASTSTDNRVTFDTTGPAVTINRAAGQPDPTNTSPIRFTAAFSEPVVDFTSADVTIAGTAGGTRTITVTGGPTTFNVAVSGITDGSVIATVGAGTVRDTAGNTNTASSSTDNAVGFDATLPRVTIDQATGQADPTSASPINFAVAFSEPVTDFTAADVTISGTANGTKAVSVTGGPNTYAVAVSGMTSDGTVVATIAAGVARDAAGNLNAASTSTDNTVIFNASVLTVTINQATGQADPTNAAPVNFTVVFSAPVEDFTSADVTIAGTAAGTKTMAVSGGPSSYSVAVSGMTSGTVIATIAAGAAHDGSGNANAASTSTDNSVVFDTNSPATAVTSPRDGDSVSGTVTVMASASDAAGIAGVRFMLNGASLGVEDTAEPYSIAWDTTQVTDGSYSLTTEARDNAGNRTTSLAVTVTVANGAVDTTPPTVAITAPANGANVSATVTVKASASDNVAVAGVQFLVDGAPLGAEDTTAPYEIAWDTTTGPDGSHSLTAVARDTADKTTTSAPVMVTAVNQAVTGTATRLENTDLSITYTPGSSSTFGPLSWGHGSRSRNWSGGTTSVNRSVGARATLTFSGTSVTWIGFRAPWAGIAKVYVDGVFAADVDLYSSAEEVQAPVYTASGLASGSHTFAVESTGGKNVLATDFAVIVDAFDVSPGIPLPTIGTRFEETSSTTTFVGAWSAASARGWSGGAALQATAGAEATFTFTGPSVRWVGLRGPASGVAQVYLDGAFHATVDMSSPLEVQAVVFTATHLAPGRHTLRLVPTTPAPVVVDAFDVQSRFEDADLSIVYTGAWSRESTDRTWSGTSANAGTGTAAMTSGGQATFTFRGTSVTWIGFRGPQVGVARVFLDDVFVANVDTRADAEAVQVPVFTASGLADAKHTLRIEATGILIVVDAFDVTLSTAAPTVTRFQEIDGSIAYTAGWTPGSGFTMASGEHVTSSDVRDAMATFTFTGTSVTWIGHRGGGSGIARVLLDGVLIATVDTWSGLQENFQGVNFTASDLTDATHTLAIQVSGERNPSSSSTRIVIDAFEVSR